MFVSLYHQYEHRTVLYRTVPYCTVPYCTLLYCTVLYCTVLYCTVLYRTVLYCTVLYCTLLYCTVLHCTVLYCTVLYCTILYIVLFVVSYNITQNNYESTYERNRSTNVKNITVIIIKYKNSIKCCFCFTFSLRLMSAPGSINSRRTFFCLEEVAQITALFPF